MIEGHLSHSELGVHASKTRTTYVKVQQVHICKIAPPQKIGFYFEVLIEVKQHFRAFHDVFMLHLGARRRKGFHFHNFFISSFKA